MPNPWQWPDDPKPHHTNILSLAGLIVGILAFILSWIPFFGIPIGHTLGILSIILSAIGIYQAPKLYGAGKLIGVSGLVLGIITVVLKSIPLLNLL